MASEGMAWNADMGAAPRDGSVVRVRRVYGGDIVFEGYAVFASLAADASMRQWADGGLDAPIAPDNDAANELGWCKPDRRYRVPTPTHWHDPALARHDKPEVGAGEKT